MSAFSLSPAPTLGRMSLKVAGLCAAGLLAAACAAGQPSALRQASGALPTKSSETFEADRAAILAMAGDFDVTFDFQETVTFKADYDVKDRYRTGGQEVVRVIADEGDFISLQHILVVSASGRHFPVKHWRQDWRYEPETVLTYVGENSWQREDVSPAERTGAWSQVVYQVDDAPRYGAVARWDHSNGISTWEPDSAWRPLPRRDATKRDDYDVVDAVNRHVITEWGWVHEQDNGKLVLRGAPELLAREIGVNTYTRSSTVPAEVAETYWAETSAYWADVRTAWAEIEANNASFGLTIKGEPEDLYSELLGLAEAVKDGTETRASAKRQAIAVIDAFTTVDVAALE